MVDGNAHTPRLVAPSGRSFAAVAVGCSAGGLEALIDLLTPLGDRLPVPVLVAQHLHKDDSGRFAAHLDAQLALEVREAQDKELPRPGSVYVAPADYHLLVEHSGRLALSIDPRVNWSRPSIDVLFESAAWAWGNKLVAVVLSGANHDGAQGCRIVSELGGLCLAQDPKMAEEPTMPEAAIEAAEISLIASPTALGEMLAKLDYEDLADTGQGNVQGGMP